MPEARRLAELEILPPGWAKYRCFPPRGVEAIGQSGIRNFASDFVVFVKLNRGGPAPKAPDFYIIPTGVVQAVPSDGKWGKVRFSRIPGFETYKGAWHLIREFLRLAPASVEDDDENEG